MHFYWWSAGFFFCNNRSVFKPFIFVKNLHPLKETSSPSYGLDDPVKKKPRFQSKPDRKHELFVKHELVAAIIESHKVLQFNSIQACNLCKIIIILSCVGLFSERVQLVFFPFSVGQRKEDHRRYEAAGEGDDKRDGGTSFTWCWEPRFSGELVFKFYPEGAFCLQPKMRPEPQRSATLWH